MSVLERTFTSEYNTNGSSEDSQVRCRAGLTDVLQIIPELIPHPFRGVGIAKSNLGESRDTGFCPQSPPELGKVPVDSIDEVGALWAWTHDAHVSRQDIYELGDLVDSASAKQTSNAGHSGVV